MTGEFTIDDEYSSALDNERNTSHELRVQQLQYPRWKEISMERFISHDVVW
jgi:hypothetical protein